MTFEQNMILALLEYMVMIFIIFRLAWEDIRDHYKPVIIFAIVTLAGQSFAVIVNEVVMAIIYFVFMILFIKIVFKNTFLISIFIALISLSLHFATNILVMGLLPLLGIYPTFQFQIGLLVLSLHTIIFFLTYLYVPLNKIITLAKNYNNLGYIISAISISFILISYYIQLQFRFGAIVNFQLLAFPILILLIGYAIFNYIYSLNNIRISKRYLSNFEEKGLNNSNLYKDFDASLKIIKALAILGDDIKTYTYIEKYFNLLDAKQEPIFTVAQTKLLDINRKALAAYLYIKMHQLNNQGISCWLNIFDTSIEGKISDRNLIEILEILINTAIEATLENKKGQTFDMVEVRDIMVTLGKEDDKSFLLVWSQWEEAISFDYFNKGHKRKESGKPYELYKIRNILVQYNYKLQLERVSFYGEKYQCFKVEL